MGDSAEAEVLQNFLGDADHDESTDASEPEDPMTDDSPSDQDDRADEYDDYDEPQLRNRKKRKGGASGAGIGSMNTGKGSKNKKRGKKQGSDDEEPDNKGDLYLTADVEEVQQRAIELLKEMDKKGEEWPKAEKELESLLKPLCVITRTIPVPNVLLMLLQAGILINKKAEKSKEDEEGEEDEKSEEEKEDEDSVMDTDQDVDEQAIEDSVQGKLQYGPIAAFEKTEQAAKKIYIDGTIVLQRVVSWLRSLSPDDSNTNKRKGGNNRAKKSAAQTNTTDRRPQTAQELIAEIEKQQFCQVVHNVVPAEVVEQLELEGYLTTQDGTVNYSKRKILSKMGYIWQALIMFLVIAFLFLPSILRA